MISTSLTTTINEFIDAGKNSMLDYSKLSFKNTLSNGTIVSVLNVISDYVEELREQSVKVKFNAEEYDKYKYKPKLLCNDVYGNPELYYIILLINDIADVKEFDKQVILMIKKDILYELLENIYNAEIKAITKYNDRNI